VSLAGRRVVVTAPVGSRLAEQLRAAGAEVIECPTIAIADPSSWDAVDQAIESVVMRAYNWVLFTSKNGVDGFFTRWEKLGGTAYGPFGAYAKVAAVGDATADRLDARGVQVDLIPSSFTAADLAYDIGSGSGKMLAARAEGAPRHAIAALESSGWTVDDVPVYRTVVGSPEPTALDQVRRGEYDAVTFTSGSTARNLVELAGPLDPGDAVAACIGPETAEVARSVGLRVDLIADPHTNDGLVQTLAAHFDES
jgi:uroporphyrinogen-III synthase